MFILNKWEYPLSARYGVAMEYPDVPNERRPRLVLPNRKDRRAMAKGKPSKGTKKDKRLKRNRRRK
jgi:hypothetical protein